MEETSLSRRKKLFILLLTLAIHALIFLILFLAFFADHILDSSKKKPTHAYDTPTILAQSPQTHEEASVILYDEPQTEARELVEPSQGAPTQAAPVVPDAAEIDEPEQPEEPAAIFEQPRNSIISIPSVEPKAEIPKPTKPQVKPQVKKQIRTQQQRPQKAAPQMTLSQLTKGFLKSMQQEQGALPRTTVDSNQLAFDLYGTKVYSVFSKSYNAFPVPTLLLNDVSTKAVFALTVRRDGSVAHVELQHPNKNHDIEEIENTIKHAIQKAGLFPPIPKKIDRDSVTLSYPVNINIDKGLSVFSIFIM